MTIKYEKTLTGYLILSAIVCAIIGEEFRLERKFEGYTKKQATQIFKKEVNTIMDNQVRNYLLKTKTNDRNKSQSTR
jgi:hypothetical protein